VTCNYDTSSVVQSGTTYDGDLSFSVSAVKLANYAVVKVFSETVSPQYPQAVDMPEFRPLTKWDIDRLKLWDTRTVFSLGPPEICSSYQLSVRKDAAQVRRRNQWE
jgi:hypothetical protein